LSIYDDTKEVLEDINFDSEGLTVAITYNGQPLTIPVPRYREEWKEEAGAMVNCLVIEVQVSDVSQPDYRDVVVLDSRTWYGDRILAGDTISWVVQFKQEEKPVLR